MRGWVRTMWNDPPGTVAFIHVWGYSHAENIRHNRLIAEQLHSAIHAITGETDFLIVPPARDPAGRDEPHLWAVRNLSPAGGLRIIDREMWSFTEITFFASGWALEIPTWLLALEGFVLANQAAITGTVRTVLERPDNRRMIDELLAGNPAYAGMGREEAAQAVLASLRVELLKLNNGNIVANVYMDSPTRDMRRWHTWVSHLRNIEYGDYTNAVATPRAI